MFVALFVTVFFPLTTAGELVTAIHPFVLTKLLLACKANPSALVVHEMATARFVSKRIESETLSTTKFAALTAVPPGAVTLMGPVVAPAGTSAVSCELLPREKLALNPLNCTAVTLVKLLPVMVIVLPATPPPGLNPLTMGRR